MTEKVYILLPVYNRREITHRFIECLKNQAWKNYHLLLIDDGSTDGTEEMVRSLIPSLTVIRGRGDWWWAGSLQEGYRWLKARNVFPEDMVLIINDDTEFDSDFLETGVSILRQIRDTLLLAQCYSRVNEQLLDAGVHVDWKKLSFTQASGPNEINCLSTRGLFMRVGDFLKIGGFYPRLLPHYASDYEFTIRANRKCLRLATDPRLRLRLDETSSGYHRIDAGSFIEFVRKYFSMKAPGNPFVLAAFVILACPPRWKLINMSRIFLGAVGTLSRQLVNSGIKAWSSASAKRKT